MTVTTFSSRGFNHDAGAAKKAAKQGPAFITDRGKPSHVLLSIEEYQRITATQAGIVDPLAMPEADIDFEPLRLAAELYRPANFS